MASAGVQKQLAKLRTQLAAGNYYEAHEMFKTVVNRHRARRNHADSYALAEEGAKLQLTQGQLNCGVELALMLVEAYQEDGVAPSEEAVARLLSILDAFPVRQLAAAASPAAPADAGGASSDGAAGGAEDPPVEAYGRVVGAASAWAKKAGAADTVAVLELRLARYLTACLGWQGLGAAARHYIAGGDAAAFASALAEAATHGAASEEDLFLVRAALATAAAPSSISTSSSRSSSAAGSQQQQQQRQQVGPSAQLEAAQALLAAYPAAAGHAAPATPLLSFVSLFLEALAARQEQLVELLLQKYKPSLDRDPALWPLVERCRGVALGRGAAGGAGGLFDLLGPLLGGA